MKIRLAVAACVAVASLTSCAAPQDAAGGDGTWGGTITTEGNVTTVVNESGSVWGGSARLVEDLSIGVETGEDPYMFGPIAGLAATEDRIYVGDEAAFKVRVYDREGRHLFDVGREGEGPGEFDNLERVAVDPAGRLLVQSLSRVTVFDLDGNLLDTWPLRWASGSSMTAASDGTVYVPTARVVDEQPFLGLVAMAPDGTEVDAVGPPEYEALQWGLIAEANGRRTGAVVLYAARPVWAVLPSKAAVRGVSDRYRFTVQRPSGASLVVERAIELPPVTAAHAEWFTLQITAVMRRMRPDWEWNANPVPARKPAFDALVGDRHGRIWVGRPLGTETITECDADPLAVEGRRAVACWRDQRGWDAFDEESGRFLGPLESPDTLTMPVFLDDEVLSVHEDEAGTIRIKRYRLVLPGEA